MDIFNEELAKEIKQIKNKLESSIALDQDDLKTILISVLSEEDLHEGN